MIIRNWKRAGIGACTTAALVVGAGLAFGPVANAAPATNPLGSTTTLLNGAVGSTTSTVNGALAGTTTAVNGALGGTTSGGSSAPIVTTTGNGIDVNLGGTTVGVTTGNGLGAGVTTGGAPVVGVQLGGTTTGATGTVTVGNGNGNGGGGGTPAPSGGPSPAPSSSTAPSGSPATPVMLTALSVVSQYSTVYPAKDGYRDTTSFTLNGTTTDGLQHAASGILSLKFGSSVVATWPITATNQVVVWNGRKAGKVVPGSYTVTASIGDADGHQVSGSDRVVVSPKKLATASRLLTSKAVSGTHKMAPQPLAGFKTGKVTFRITSVASKVKGKQYLVFKRGAKKIKVRILNGKHTSKSFTIPKSFTSYTISHTWKKGTVKIKSLKYKYTYKALK